MGIKKYILVLLSIYSFSVISQNPVNWETNYDKFKETITFSAEIESDWHLYAVYVPSPNDGPLPTVFSFEENINYTLIDSIQQLKPKIIYDKNFGLELAYYERKTSFYQKIKTQKKSFIISGNINYMTCNENMCIPYDFAFEIKINLQD
jgi:thiol:disulfide interchange protein DsbD